MKLTKVERRAKWLRKPSPGRKRRVCQTCGKIGYYPPNAKQCIYLIGMLGSYICGGKVVPVLPTPRKSTQEAVREWVADTAAKEDRVKDAIVKRLEAAWRKVDEHSDAVHRHAQLQREWQSKARRLAKQLFMSDTELALMRDRARQNLKGKKKKPVRGMQIQGGI